MHCEVTFPPELGLDPAGFADLWNESSACRRVARARVAHAQEVTSTETCVLLRDLDAAASDEELERLVQHVVRQQGADAPLQVAVTERPGGVRLLAVQPAGSG